ncbi:hypothetical protein [Nocardia rhizosphaerae]|uniref:Uncharacterized protein n=1 Tax=Nocardia rhizosphaerae TaxID=1691571 RepID=A0ABV8KZW3_9NOCA
MTTFLVLAAVAVIGLTAYRFSPTSADTRFWPSFRSAHDHAFDTYDDQRLHRELDTMRARADTA